MVKYSRYDGNKKEVTKSEVGTTWNRVRIQFYNLTQLTAGRILCVGQSKGYPERSNGVGRRKEISLANSSFKNYDLAKKLVANTCMIQPVEHSKCFCSLNQTNHTVPTVPFISVCKPPVKWCFADFVRLPTA